MTQSPYSLQIRCNASSRHLRRMLASACASIALTACGGGSEIAPPIVNPPPVINPPPARTPETFVFSASDGVSSNGASELYAGNDVSASFLRISATMPSTSATISSFKISPDGQWIAFVERGSIAETLFVASNTGGSIARISQAGGAVTRIGGYDWSPDSMRLTFAVDNGGPAFNLFETFVADRDGGNLKKINGSIGSPPTVEVRQPLWSPDGRFVLQEVARITAGAPAPVAFALNFSDPAVGATTSTRLTSATTALRNPRWASDGARVCYNMDNGAGFQIRTSNVNQAAPNSTVLSNSGTFNGECRWSANGLLVAYLEQTAVGGPADLKVRAADASSPAEFTVALASAGRTIRQFDWAPGSDTRLAYIADADAAGEFALYVVDRGGASRKLSPMGVANGDVLRFAWSPDAAKIAFLGDLNADAVVDLYVANADGSGVQRISDFLAADEVVDFAWSHDGTRLALTAGPISNSPVADRLYIATADGAVNITVGGSAFTEIFTIEYAD